ncbi:hypothetical protein IWW42_005799, partial [Coemansia sp. RSA 1085]
EKKEAPELRKSHLRDNIDYIIAIAAPSDEKLQQQAHKYAETISLLLSRLLSNDIEGESYNIISRCLENEGKDEYATTSTLDNNAVAFFQWLHSRGDENRRPSAAQEQPMYAGFLALFAFVTGCIGRLSSSAGNVLLLRRILPFIKADKKPRYSENSARIDLGLTCEPLDGNDTFQRDDASDNIEMPRRFDEPSYRRLFAVVEAKGGSTPADQTDAFEQLILYSKNMYAVQHNRRLLWGITACGAVVKACLFGPNFMLASTEMDLGSEEGRSELVRLIVYWSFCELDKLGYDPSVRFNREHGCMEIDVAPPGNGDGTGKQTFYLCEVIAVAERVFGRHTRCFIAHRGPGSAIERVIENGVIIKDAWPEAAESVENDDRDKTRYLHKIHEELPGDRYDGMYPEFLEGGRVYFGNEDTTQQFVGDSVWRQLNEHAEREGKQMALRVHKRIAMKGIGKPLKTINSCLELIIIVADVMNCHSGIERCNILHQDISTANILARVLYDREPGGMPINFDMAVDIDGKGNAIRTECIRTYPFMSVGNLEGSLHSQTALDDWKSLLYILCWLGTYDWNTATLRIDIDDLEIND